MTILDIESATQLVENSISAGRRGFFVNTEFGKIAIEVDVADFSREPFVISAWEDAPNTKWAMRHRFKECDFHIMIEKAKTEFGTHYRVIRALSQCLFIHIFGKEVNDDVLDAAVMTYITDIDNQSITTNALEKEYALNNLGIVSRCDPSVLNVVRELIVRRVNDAMAIMEVGRKLSGVSRNGWEPMMIYNFDATYHRDLLYIILFVAELTSRHLSLSIDFHDIRTVDMGQFTIINETKYINGACTLKLVGQM